MTVTVLHGDMLAVLPTLDADSLDSCVTDPPYHLTSMVKRLSTTTSGDVEKNFTKTIAGQKTNPHAAMARGFMGREWDGGDIASRVETWAEVYRVLKPGAHLLAFGGTRTFHRMVCAIEDAGFEVRDSMAWLYASGFPKSHDVSKAIDATLVHGNSHSRQMKKTNETRPGEARFSGLLPTNGIMNGNDHNRPVRDKPMTDAARQWQGWGTALKPAAEYICVAQKPYTESQQFDMLGSRLNALEHRLWSLLPVNVAVESFRSSQSEFDAACASAPWSAAERSNTQAALSAQMDTSQFVSALITSLNTVSSWRDCLVEASIPENTSTIETASSTTIDLKIWKSCLSRITPASIILAHKSGSWSSVDAGPAEQFLNACVSKWNATRELSALVSALDSDATNYPAEGALSPNLELICVARKPLSEKTIAANVLKHGTGGLNINACRIEVGAETAARAGRPHRVARRNEQSDIDRVAYGTGLAGSIAMGNTNLGRWPANVCHDGSDEVLAGFPETGTSSVGRIGNAGGGNVENIPTGMFRSGDPGFGDSGSAARFFYAAKADKTDRLASKHPTVKPVDLIRWLIRLITPPGGTVLDCFAGSGTTAMAALAEGFNAVLIEREAEYVADINRRLAHVSGEDTPLFARDPAREPDMFDVTK